MLIAKAQEAPYDINVDMDRGVGVGFLSYIPPELSQIGHTRFVIIALMEVDNQQEIGDQPSKELYQDPVWTTRDEMIDLEVFFPPCKEDFDFPPQRIDESNFLGR